MSFPAGIPACPGSCRMQQAAAANRSVRQPAEPALQTQDFERCTAQSSLCYAAFEILCLLAAAKDRFLYPGRLSLSASVCSQNRIPAPVTRRLIHAVPRTARLKNNACRADICKCFFHFLSGCNLCHFGSRRLVNPSPKACSFSLYCSSAR